MKMDLLSLIINLFIIGIFVVDIWIVVALFIVRKGAANFLRNSKKENFEKTKKLLKTVKSVLAGTVILDMFFLYRFLMTLKSGFFSWALLFMLIVSAVHFIIAIPILKMGNKAQRRYLHLYPPTSAYRAPTNKVDVKLVDTNWDEWFNNSEEYKSKIPDKVNETLDIMAEADSELIKYVEGGYSEGQHTDLRTERTEDNSELRICPFCGTLNGIKNEVCDFCGAELKAEE